MSLQTPLKVGKLQKALHDKAKGSPKFRFYLLYDKVYREDIIQHAYALCRNNRGAPGVDGQTFEDIEEYGVEEFLGELSEELRQKKYRPQPVRRVYIPKPDGRQRPLGIPTIRDRVVQTAALIVLEPIFEADLQPEQFAYRPERSAKDAIVAVHGLLGAGHTEVIDADLSGYFDTIPHPELMRSVARRVSDKHMLRLIKAWLETPIEESDGHGGRRRSTRNKDTGRGIPQGAPISPLLSNLYMRRFLLAWKQHGHDKRLQAHIINYADDFVICCRRGMSHKAMHVMRHMMAKLKLTVNEKKTRRCQAWEEPFVFLGYRIGKCYKPQGKGAYLGTRPAVEKIKRLCRKISEYTSRQFSWMSHEEQVTRINRVLTGWANYFDLGQCTPAYRAVDLHVRHRLRQWLCTKHKVRGSGRMRYPDDYLYLELGLVQLCARSRSFS